MTKTKQQLRAEAVERLKQLDEHDGGGDIVKAMVPEGVTVNRTNWTVELDTIIDLLTDDCDTECYECARLAELVAENSALRAMVDEPANGNDGETNGIANGSPLVDDMPEGDAVAILRDWLDYKINRFDAEANAIILNTGADPGKLYEIADMVERNYVSREAYEDLRDEFVWETTFLHRIAKKCGTEDVPSLVAYVEQLEAKVDELTADVSQAVEDTAERVTNDGEMYDNREKLEADANGYVMSWWQSDWVDSFGHADSMKRDIMRLLDRQAAIDCKKFQTILKEIQECTRNGSR